MQEGKESRNKHLAILVLLIDIVDIVEVSLLQSLKKEISIDAISSKMLHIMDILFAMINFINKTLY